MKVIGFSGAWWDARNKVNAGEPLWQTGQQKRDKPMIQNVNWSLPNSDFVQINFDEAFLENKKSGAWDFVVRDHKGQVVLAGAGSLDKVHDALRRSACRLDSSHRGSRSRNDANST